MKSIFCDKCKKDITIEWFDPDGRSGHCTGCGKDLCGLCSGNWRDIDVAYSVCSSRQADAEVVE